MRSLPKVQTLKQAVKQVIESNKSDGYIPTRFIQATGNGDAPNLLSVCEKLIVKGETLEYLENALKRFPILLTLEDFVVRHGITWGFSGGTVEVAGARVKYFDLIAGMARYVQTSAPSQTGYHTNVHIVIFLTVDNYLGYDYSGVPK